MQTVEPEVYLIAVPQIRWDAMLRYLAPIGGRPWLETHIVNDDPAVAEIGDGQDLVEFMGRLCYRSWAPGLNKNVTRVRTDQAAYFKNILASGHGSVLEHASYSFVLQNVSRVLTHELVRHRVGVAISQESLRFVRAGDIRLWLPPELHDDETLILTWLEETELLAKRLYTLHGLDEEQSFAAKKQITSAIRRVFPQGMATDIGWTANVRTLRSTIEMRTAPSAEVEIRLVFDKIARIMQAECPLLFGDYEVQDGAFVTPHRKV